jgi:hypothetical protein
LIINKAKVIILDWKKKKFLENDKLVNKNKKAFPINLLAK